MRRFAGFRQRFGRFARHDGGNFAVVFGVAASAVMLGVGFGVDTVQLMNAKSALREAVDAAVTSTARAITVGDITEQDAPKMVEAFLTANSNGGILAYDQVVLDRLTIDKTEKTVEAAAHVDVSLYFPLFGMPNMRRVANTGAAVYSDKHIEVAMMLDVTGSMAGQKIIDLRTAAANAVDAFLGGQDPARPRVRIALVPYANSVNAGALAESSVGIGSTAADRRQLGPNTDPTPVATRPDTCATERIGAYQYSDAGPDVSMVNRDYLLSAFVASGYGGGTKACPDAAVMPLSADGDALKNTIKNLNASGGTAGHIGVQWTWYMLSNKWNSVLAASQRPAAPNPGKVAKFAVLMTDGEFNLSYFDVTDVKEVYNAKGKAETRTAATTLCAAMRDQGIEVFTIGFALSEANAESTLQSCATPDTGSVKHFYQAATGAELDAAFQSIAANIERLALTR